MELVNLVLAACVLSGPLVSGNVIRKVSEARKGTEVYSNRYSSSATWFLNVNNFSLFIPKNSRQPFVIYYLSEF